LWTRAVTTRYTTLDATIQIGRTNAAVEYVVRRNYAARRTVGTLDFYGKTAIRIQTETEIEIPLLIACAGGTGAPEIFAHA